jgi:hypothetical protein
MAAKVQINRYVRLGTNDLSSHYWSLTTIHPSRYSTSNPCISSPSASFLFPTNTNTLHCRSMPVLSIHDPERRFRNRPTPFHNQHNRHARRKPPTATIARLLYAIVDLLGPHNPGHILSPCKHLPLRLIHAEPSCRDSRSRFSRRT